MQGLTNAKALAKPWSKKPKILVNLRSTGSNPVETGLHEGFHISNNGGFALKDSKWIESEVTKHNKGIMPKLKKDWNKNLTKEEQQAVLDSIVNPEELRTRMLVNDAHMADYPGLQMQDVINTLGKREGYQLPNTILNQKNMQQAENFLDQYGSSSLNLRQLLGLFEPESLNHFAKNYRSLVLPIMGLGTLGMINQYQQGGQFKPVDVKNLLQGWKPKPPTAPKGEPLGLVHPEMDCIFENGRAV